jgi:hypothetical protein
MPRTAGWHGVVRHGQALDVVPTLTVPCSNCDAPIGERCRMWRKQDGVRLYIKGWTDRHHPERKALAKKGAA